MSRADPKAKAACASCGEPRRPLTERQVRKLRDPADRWLCPRCRRGGQQRFAFVEPT